MNLNTLDCLCTQSLVYTILHALCLDEKGCHIMCPQQFSNWNYVLYSRLDTQIEHTSSIYNLIRCVANEWSLDANKEQGDMLF